MLSGTQYKHLIMMKSMSITTMLFIYSKTCVKWPLSKRPKIVLQYQLMLNAGQKYCRMLPLEHSAILSTLIKLPSVIKIFVLSILHKFYCFVCLFDFILYVPVNIIFQLCRHRTSSWVEPVLSKDMCVLLKDTIQ